MIYLSLSPLRPLLELRKLVLEDFVEAPAFTSTWNHQAHLSHEADNGVEKSGEENVDCQRLISTIFVKNKVRHSQ